MKASAKQSNDQNDPAPVCNSVPPCSDDEQPGSELQIQETTTASLIDNWIDA